MFFLYTPYFSSGSRLSLLTVFATARSAVLDLDRGHVTLTNIFGLLGTIVGHDSMSEVLAAAGKPARV